MFLALRMFRYVPRKQDKDTDFWALFFCLVHINPSASQGSRGECLDRFCSLYWSICTKQALKEHLNWLEAVQAGEHLLVIISSKVFTEDWRLVDVTVLFWLKIKLLYCLFGRLWSPEPGGNHLMKLSSMLLTSLFPLMFTTCSSVL